jgi:phage tail sheath protein FI
MPVTTSFPGLYIEEIASSVHTITAAPTSIAVFVGYTHPYKTQTFLEAVQVFDFTDYQAAFGGLYNNDRIDSNVAYAVQNFFLNGGSQAYVVGLPPQLHTPNAAAQPFPQPTYTAGSIVFTGLEPIDAGHALTVTVSNVSTDKLTADIIVTYGTSVVETYRRVSLTATNTANYIETRLAHSNLISVSAAASGASTGATGAAAGTTGATGATAAGATGATAAGATGATGATAAAGATGATGATAAGATGATAAGATGATGVATGTYGTFTAGVFTLAYPGTIDPNAVSFNSPDFAQVFQADSSLDKVPIFNILVIPGVSDPGVWSEAIAFAESKRAFLIMDAPYNDAADNITYPTLQLVQNDVQVFPQSINAALYFPYVVGVDTLSGDSRHFPPSCCVAGVFARIDANRGVWKAPAGLEASLTNTTGVVPWGTLTDARAGVLNPLGVNCIRTFAGSGTVVFGARTTTTANLAFEQWRYVPVRRMALFLEQTLLANLGWVVFEPNAEPLWLAITTSIQAFMLTLFNQGAFQGTTPAQAFQVKCDSSTTTQTDIDNGVVNILVAFAPLKPAEFVVIQIAQLAGQAQS